MIINLIRNSTNHNIYNTAHHLNLNKNMTRYVKRKTEDRLHCTFSAIVDIFEMINEREPSPQEINNLLVLLGDKAAIIK